MSTSINPNNLPDEKILENLANEIFSAVPGNVQNAFLQAFGSKESLVPKDNNFDLSHPQTSLPDPRFPETGIPKSVTGNGISSSAGHQGQELNLDKHHTNLSDPNFVGKGINPKSIGGSGISPSAGYQGNEVNIDHPQTSLPDPNFAGRSGISPSTLQQGPGNYAFQEKTNQFSQSNPYQIERGIHTPSGPNQLPYESEQPFEKELSEALKTINLSSPGQQLPVNFTGLNAGSYYFLSGKEQLNTGNSGLSAISSAKGITSLASPPFDVNLVRKDFPILSERVGGKPLIWLDNAATTQKPQSVIDRISYFYHHENSNIHRAAHELAARATDAYEEARKKVKDFINAGSINEIIFVRGATEAINLVAKSWGEQYLVAGDEIIVSHLEHHANIVPWQQLATKKGLKIKVIPVDEDGQVLLDEYAKLLSPKTKLVSFTQVSNALGTVTPAKQIVEMAHLAGAKVMVDGAQSVSHMRVDVQALNCDWFVFSGHKVFGPTGIGVVYGKEAILNETQPWQGGGNMIVDVTFENTTYHKAPGRFEAGTGNIADAVGLGAAIDYVNKIGIEVIYQYEHYLLLYATRLLKDVPGLRLIGTAPDKASVLSFVLDGYRTEEVGAALNKEGIAVRSGHHCAQPILRRFGLESTVRPSLAFYNTCEEIDTLVTTIYKLRSAKPINSR